MKRETLKLHCDAGYISKIQYIGIIPDTINDNLKGDNIIYQDFCGNPKKIDSVYDCNKMIMPSYKDDF